MRSAKAPRARPRHERNGQSGRGEGRHADRAARPPKKRRWGKAALALALALAVVLIWQYVENIAPSTIEATRPTGAAGAPAQTVRAAAAASGQMPITIDALGIVTPLATVTVKTQIAGKLMEVGFEEGQLVKKGDFLAQIDPRPYQAAVALAAGATGQGLRALRAGSIRLHALRNAEQAGFDLASAGRGPAVPGGAGQGRDGERSSADRRRQFECLLLPHRLAGRRPSRPSARRSGQLLQPSDATGIVVIAQLDPISVVFSTPEDNLPQITRALEAPARRCPSRRSTAPTSSNWRRER